MREMTTASPVGETEDVDALGPVDGSWSSFRAPGSTAL